MSAAATSGFSVVVFLALSSFQVSRAADQGSCCPLVSQRQNSIPVLYVTGTHYEVGYNVGRTFGTIIKEFTSTYEPLQKELLPLYSEPKGRQIYEESLTSATKYFPQYVIELKGMAHGAKIPFHELFLMALDDTLLLNMNTTTKDKGPVGCSSLIINKPNAQLLGHTEDALNETLNNYYIVAAHVVPGEDERGGVFPAREEKFEALTYAGHLPGYASGHNHHGLVFSINTIFVSEPLRGKIPREFITRALLAARADVTEVLDVVTNEGVGTADGFNVNLAFLDVPAESREFYTVEVVPKVDEPRSDVYLSKIRTEGSSFHANRLLNLKYPELHEGAYESSLTREARYKQMTSNKIPANIQDLLEILGNRDDNPYPLFSDRPDARVITINLCVFDFKRKTWTMWSSDPLTNPPLTELPLTFTDLVSPIGSEVVINRLEDLDPFFIK